MTIINNATMTDNNLFSAFVASHHDEEITTWSVQIASKSYADDTYCGTYDEARAYAEQYKMDNPDDNVQLALMTLTEDGAADYCEDIEYI